MAKKIIFKIFKIYSSLLFVAVFLLAAALVGVRLFGLSVYNVLSPSMEPDYPTGSVIYVADCDTDSLEKRDVITFRLTEKTTATHRIIRIEEKNGERLFYTKGDNNQAEDKKPVEESEVIGKVVFCIPYLGYLSRLIRTPVSYFLIIICAAALVLTAFLERLNKQKNE